MSTEQVLKGSGNQGDFVLQNQELATQQGFSHVSKKWYDKTIDYDTALEKFNQMAADREDIIVHPKYIKPAYDEDTGWVGFEHIDGRKFSLTEHAARQYASRTHISHAFVNSMMRPVYKQNGDVKFHRDDEDRYAFYTVLANGHRRLIQDKKYRWRTYKDGTLRAFLSADYAPIDNRWYLKLLQRFIPGGRISHFNFSTADTCYGNILIPDTIRTEDDSDYGGMISISNCEIGIRRLEQYPSVFRAICMNGCIWDQTKGSRFSQVHRGNLDMKELALRIFDNVNKQIPLLTQGIDLMFELKTLKFDGLRKQIIAQVAKENAFTGDQARTFVSKFLTDEKDSHNNAFGLVNAITRAGQEFDAETWVKFDLAAGNIVKGGSKLWDKIKKRASTLTDDDMVKVFSRKGSALAI